MPKCGTKHRVVDSLHSLDKSSDPIPTVQRDSQHSAGKSTPSQEEVNNANVTARSSKRTSVKDASKQMISILEKLNDRQINLDSNSFLIAIPKIAPSVSLLSPSFHWRLSPTGATRVVVLVRLASCCTWTSRLPESKIIRRARDFLVPVKVRTTSFRKNYNPHSCNWGAKKRS